MASGRLGAAEVQAVIWFLELFPEILLKTRRVDVV
jgi:hypothetical protein